MDGECTPEDVHDRLVDDEDCLVVDIRGPAAFERGHIPGSENLPLEELTARVHELDDADRIVTVCPHGQASVQAARLISAYEGCADARVESMAGGLEVYQERFGLVGGDDAGAPF